MDRVSNLPDEVLCHILSFLTTKEAALTSILAKRWRNLLAFVPFLTIDNSEFLHPETGKRERPHIKQSFVDFVDRVLALQGNSPLKIFSLRCFAAVETDRVDGWISNVLARAVSDLEIIVSGDYYHVSPKCFECSTLVTLSLGSGIDVTLAAGRIFLPVLKTLVLVWVTVCPNEFETLLHDLPSLEELVLTRVLWKGRDVIVSSATVKTLTMYLGFWLKTLSIDTPSLVQFECSGVDALDYPVVNMGNLVDAKIKQLGDTKYSNLWKLFHGMRNVSHLILLPDTLEVLSTCSESLPVFNNLKSLAIESHEYRGWQAMLALLRNCPHLETLAIKGLLHRVTDKCGDVCDCISREEKGLSLKLCPVKEMEIYGFQGTMKEMAMIKHFLDYFPCLKEMDVYAEENNNPTQLGNQRVLEMFQLYNKLSSCNVQLCI